MRILVCDDLDSAGVEILLAGGFQVEQRPEVSAEELAAIISEYDALIVRSRTRVTSDLLKRASKLRVIGRAGAGVDNIDVAAATRRGIVVMNAASGNTITTAEHTIAMLMALARNIPQANWSTKSGRWEKGRFVGVELMGKVLGVIGVGRIGSAVAARAKGLGMQVIGHDPYFTREAARDLGLEMVSLDELLSRSDFITLHVPLTEETKHMINSSTIEKMKPGVRIINCARGGIVDERALASSIRSGKVAGAAIDVFEREPVEPDNPLLGLDSVIVTPHLGASTQEAQLSVATMIAEQVRDYLSSGVVRGAVNLPAVSAEQMATIGPYIALGEKIGRFQGLVFGHDLQQVNIEYSGEVVELDVRPVTRAVLAGLLGPVIERINMVNAAIVAEERGIKVMESRSRSPRNFASLIEVRAVTSSGASEVSGALFGRIHPRIVRVNEFELEAIPEGYMLIVFNRDVPGVLGRIATFIGNHNVNIARLYLGRKNIGEQALALIQIDQPMPESAVAGLAQLREVISAKQIKL
jgi:D-3-phosphoglycerate dehydrogenase